MSRLTIVGLALLFSLLIGLAQEPDSGPGATTGPPGVAAAVAGPRHGAPLPDVPSVRDLLLAWQAVAPAVLALLLAIRPAGPVRAESDDRRSREARSLVSARRAPPVVP